MDTAIKKLLEIAGPSLSLAGAKLDQSVGSSADSLLSGVLHMLTQKNGFYAFESGLHVFPSQSAGREIGLDSWNSATLWRDSFGDLVEDCFFFAEDVFGVQFCTKRAQVHTFDPETGALNRLAADIDGWAAAILDDYNLLTGYPIAHEWQLKNGPIPSRMRLMPKIPFVAGGEYRIENLALIDSVTGMRLRGDIARQIKDLPDGSQIRLRIVE